MKFPFFNLWVIAHKHKWEWQFDEYHTIAHGHEIKVYEKCVAPDCRLGAYRSVCWIECNNKPNVVRAH